MNLFKLKTNIHTFKTFRDFSDEFKIGSEDLIVCSESAYKKYIQGDAAEAAIIFPKKYGSGEPTSTVIDKVIKQANTLNYSRVIAVGGGAILDIAKLLVLRDLTTAKAIFNKEMDFHKDKKLVMIPTTCGTGSEVTNISVAEIKELKTKLGVALEELYGDDAVLIPELLQDLPYKYFAFSSIDALVHAMESFVAPKSNRYTKMYAAEAIKLIISGFQKLLDNGKQLTIELLEDFLFASNFAGIAFGNTGTGAVHALSYPVGGNYHLAHGESNYQFLVEVFKRYTEIKPEGKVSELNCYLKELLHCDDNLPYDALAELLSEIWENRNLKSYGMKDEEADIFAEDVIKNQQRLLSNNYVQLSKKELSDIYKKRL
ncbi:4-hydroxybutyrate dehydrogenase [Clostridium oryzae]|uniref:NAD-dependent methanol dehydrogenase n=1 Tax=Clostridium oryzae TaxID=1450648 RepID=A0A1V4ID34_9CLOT|nr:4-hydroxybutyrate dehydrogenase [Clostridium oryzae]OPJ57427.1 NAD-dependent methanol dehydrogenase [Clostridium oryzae]